MNIPLPTLTVPHQDQTADFVVESDSAPTEEGTIRSQALCHLIAEQPFFKGLTPAHMQKLTESAMQVQFEQGQSIFQEGSPANRFYLILEGAVVLESEMEGGGMIPVQILGPGDN